MSDLTSAGFRADESGFQVQFIENVEGDAHIEVTTPAEKKIESDIDEYLRRGEVAAADTLEISDSASYDEVFVENSTRVAIRVVHLAEAGTCKVIPVGFFTEDASDLGHTPLGELTFAAGDAYIEVPGEPPTNEYPSDIQIIDAAGFSKIFFLVSDISVDNTVAIWAWPL